MRGFGFSPSGRERGPPPPRRARLDEAEQLHVELQPVLEPRGRPLEERRAARSGAPAGRGVRGSVIRPEESPVDPHAGALPGAEAGDGAGEALGEDAAAEGALHLAGLEPVEEEGAGGAGVRGVAGHGQLHLRGRRGRAR